MGWCARVLKPATRESWIRMALALCVLSLVAACGARDDDRDQGDGVEAARTGGLPAPEGAGGSVTGMPSGPGPGVVPLPGDLPPESPVSADEESGPLSAEDLRNAGILPIEPGGEPGLAETATQAEPVEPRDPARHVPAPGNAVGVIRDYYAALNARNQERVRALWADGGGSRGPSEAQLTAGFPQADSMSVGVGGAGAVDTTTGVPYVEVPVDVTASYQDGSQRHFRGIYTLRGDAGGWRIVSADIREVMP
jgi:hypothetical protein